MREIVTTETRPFALRLVIAAASGMDPAIEHAALSTALISLTLPAMLLLDRLDGLERLLVGAGRG
jgi:putative spermidine/putrescine transport system permease protein